MSLRWVFDALSPAGQRGRLSVLLFHRVRPHKDPLFPNEADVAEFETRMRWIRDWFRVLPLEEALR
ncbi:MAG: polysaccharide deacetylase family protein, partial [Burkholderiales bacterium]|nr:polysaccharide deacetylase family protein [Burkholderiales bacterium]